MNYKEVVDKIREAVNQHTIIADFGYGQFSDIKVLDEQGDGADYPYAFLLPTGITRAEQAVTYSFNFIMMEMAKSPEAILDVQSKCLQYIDDIIADLRADTGFEPELLLTQSTQVFRERFQDEVAGATATFNIVAPQAIDACFIPGGVIPTTTTTTTTAAPTTFGVNELPDQTRDPDPSGAALSVTQPPTQDVNGWWNLSTPYNAFYVPGGYTYRIMVSGIAEQTPPAAGEVPTQTPPGIKPHEIIAGSAVRSVPVAPTSTTWPQHVVGAQFTWEAQYDWTAPATTGLWSLNQTIRGLVGVDESSIRLVETTYTFEQL